jgi:hypothetical protein
VNRPIIPGRCFTITEACDRRVVTTVVLDIQTTPMIIMFSGGLIHFDSVRRVIGIVQSLRRS